MQNLPSLPAIVNDRALDLAHFPIDVPHREDGNYHGDSHYRVTRNLLASRLICDAPSSASCTGVAHSRALTSRILDKYTKVYSNKLFREREERGEGKRPDAHAAGRKDRRRNCSHVYW